MLYVHSLRTFSLIDFHAVPFSKGFNDDSRYNLDPMEISGMSNGKLYMNLVAMLKGFGET